MPSAQCQWCGWVQSAHDLTEVEVEYVARFAGKNTNIIYSRRYKEYNYLCGYCIEQWFDTKEVRRAESREEEQRS